MNYPQLLEKIVTEGKSVNIRNNRVYELINVDLEVKYNNFFYTKNTRQFMDVYQYFKGELIWYFSGSRNVKYIMKYSKFWKNLGNIFNRINSNYGYLVFYKKRLPKFITGFQWCINQFKKDLFTRQAVILYNDKDYFYEGNKDFICTQLQQFFVRPVTEGDTSKTSEYELTSIVYIRSSDAVLGLTYDIPWWSIVQQQIFHYIKQSIPNLRLGSLIIKIGSAHVYYHKSDLVKAMVKEGIIETRLKLNAPIPLNKKIDWYEENIQYYYEIESGWLEKYNFLKKVQLKEADLHIDLTCRM